MSRFFFDFGHPNQIVIRLEIIEGGGLVIELISEYDHEIARAAHALLDARKSR